MSPEVLFERPLIILGAPRSGTTILQRCLAAHRQVWHLAAESHAILEGPFHPAAGDYESNRVTAVEPLLAAQLQQQFYRRSINLNQILANPLSILQGSSLLGRVTGRLLTLAVGAASRRARRAPIRFLEKTPKNALRVPMLNQLFPDALFIWMQRQASSVVDSLIDGWFAFDRLGPITLRKRFATYPLADRLQLVNYPHHWWNFVLVPGWKELAGRRVADVAAWQYYQCNRFILDDLAGMAPDRRFVVRYEEFVQDPWPLMQQLLAWAGLDPDDRAAATFARALPRIGSTGDGGSRRSLRHGAEIARAFAELPQLAELQAAMNYPVVQP